MRRSQLIQSCFRRPLLILLFVTLFVDSSLSEGCSENEVCAGIQEPTCSNTFDLLKSGKLTILDLVATKTCGQSKFCCEVEGKVCAENEVCAGLQEPACSKVFDSWKTGKTTISDLKSKACGPSVHFCCEKEHKNIQVDVIQPDDPSYIPSSEEGECGFNNDNSNIVGGTETKPGVYTFPTLLGYHVEDKIDYICGGSLINKWYVLSAAHCFRNTELEQGVVNVGDWRVSTKKDCFEGDCLEPNQIVDIQTVIIHENYKGFRTGSINDIALIKVRTKIHYNDETKLSPVCLPIDNAYNRDLLKINNWEDDLVGVRAKAIGWGRTTTFEGDSEREEFDSTRSIVTKDGQQEVTLPIVSNQQCAKSGLFKHLSESHVCAGGETGKDSCSGDSGGPLVINIFHRTTKILLPNKDASAWFVVGITSFGDRYCGSGNVGFYTRVSKYIDWIKKNMV